MPDGTGAAGRIRQDGEPAAGPVEAGVPPAAPGAPAAGDGAPAAEAPPEPDAAAVLRSTAYLRLLVLAALLGVPISAAAYGFLQAVAVLQRLIFSDLPVALGLGPDPVWWPFPLLAVGGLLVGAAIHYLPGRGGASPADGFGRHPAPTARELPGVVLAALGTLVFGAVLGPEAPLIALGGGLALLAVRAARHPPPQRAQAIIASAGSFAAISALLGSPLIAAFLLMEAAGLGGATLGLVLVPGLLAAGIGSLTFVGLGVLTGLGSVSLAIPDLPPFVRPELAQFGWAIVIGVAAALLGTGIGRLALPLRTVVQRSEVLLTGVAGLVVAGLASLYTVTTGHPTADVLFSGQSALPRLLTEAHTYGIGALVVLLACKGLGYSVSLSAFRGGPVFPSLFLGAAGGLALSGLPGLSMVPAVAMGIGAMCAVMLRLPLTSVMLAVLLLGSDGLVVTPLVIVAVVVAYVGAAWLRPAPTTDADPTPDG